MLNFFIVILRKTLFKEYLLFPLLYLLVSTAMLWPQLQQPYPALIDDGTDMLMAKQLSFQQLFTIDLFSQERTWPLRMQYRKILYTLFGEKIEWHFGVNVLLLVAIFISIRLLLLQVGVKHWLSFFSPLLLAVLPSVYAATYRLGPVELIQASFYLIGLWFLVRKKYFVAVIIFTLNLFNKETSIFYLLPLGVYLLVMKKKWLLFLTGVITIGLLMLIWYKSDHLLANYITRSQFSWEYIAQGLKWNTWTYSLLFLNFILFVRKSTFKLKEVTLLVAYFSTFLPFFIWNIGQQYYYQLPNHLLGLLCLVMLLNDFFENSRNSIEKWLKLSLITVIFCWQLVTVLLPHSLLTTTHWQKVYYIGGNLAHFLMKNDLSNSHVYIAVADFEEHNKIEIYARDWRGRNIEFIPTSAQWYEYQSDYKMLEKLTAIAIEEFLADPNQNKVLISDQFIGSDVTNSFEVTPFCTKPDYKYKDCWFYVFTPKSDLRE